MMKLAFRIFLLVLFLTPVCFGQPMLRLKARTIKTDVRREAQSNAPLPSRGHLVVQFDDPPAQETVAALAQQGVRVLADVPDNALLVAVDQPVNFTELGARYVMALESTDKVSPLLASDAAPGNNHYLVEFHRDVDMGFARSLILNQGIELRDNPDLAPGHLMIRISDRDAAAQAIWNLAGLDEVAYIFPASDELASGTPVIAYAEPLTADGTAGQLIATNGDGWDGPGKNATTLNYFFSQMTSKLPAGTAQTEIQKAMAEWSKVIKLTWQAGSSAAATRTVNILFGRGAHGDNYPFDGPGNSLAHTFYPAPPNPESIAGDLHIDDDENWHAGTDVDLFSVVLHELGHALGLGHSDDPNAVMYPYYKRVTTLAADDKNAILSMYAAQDAVQTPTTPATPTPPTSAPTPSPAPPAPTPPPAPPQPGPLTLTVNVPAATTTAATLTLTGSVSGGSGTVSVFWSSTSGAWSTAQLSGSNWTIANVPLTMGANIIAITAADRTGQVSRWITVTRQAASQPGTTDRTPPTLTITSPSQATVATTLTTALFTGTASDNVGVASVTWSTSAGSSGTASGTTRWSASIPLIRGSNTVTIRAADTAGNVAWRTVVVTRR